MNESEAYALARRLNDPDGFKAFRQRQASERTPPEYGDAEDVDGPEPIGIWKPADDGSFVRTRPWSEGDFWAPAERLEPKRGPRVVLLGESTAAGMFYRPRLSPASALQTLLPGWDVVDLAKISIGRVELIGLAYDAMQLLPDAIVFFAGNNWTRRAAPWADLATMQDWGAALEAGGVPALRAWCRSRLREDVEDALDDLASLGVPVLLVVPEINLADWERRRPPPWLPGDGSPRWHALWERGDADALVRLDGGLCAASQRLRFRRAQTDAERLAAARAEVDAADWDGWFGNVPQAGDPLREALLAGGRRRGFRIVDLRTVFAEHTGSLLPGRRLFVDYCHLTPEGMGVAAAAMASELVQQPVRPPALPLNEETAALCRFQSQLHTAHRESPLELRRPRFDGPPDAMRQLLQAKLSGLPPVLASARQHPSGLDPHVWAWPNVDAGVLEGLAEAVGVGLPDAGCPGELARPYSLERFEEAFLEGGALHPGLSERAFLRAPWPDTVFCALAGAGDATLEVTARVPVVEQARPGRIEVGINGAPAGSLESSSRWTRARFRVSLRPGLNRISLRWPALAADGDVALARARENFLLGRWTDLFPVFGELASLRLAPA